MRYRTFVYIITCRFSILASSCNQTTKLRYITHSFIHRNFFFFFAMFFHLERSHHTVQNRRSPESTVSYGAPPTVPDSTASPQLVQTNRTRRAGYVSPDYPKPRTPYEDKVIPTLRNRNRTDGGHTQGSVTANTDATGLTNEETESVYGGTNAAPNDDATAELNQAEMIEANQMMIVFDKQLVRVWTLPFDRFILHFRSVNSITETMHNVRKL